MKVYKMEKIFIIAEAGVNHNGSIQLAKKLIDKAVEAGADCIKFQTFKTENLVNKNAVKADYQIINTKNNDTQFEMLKKLELSYSDFLQLKNYSDKKGIIFLSTPFDIETIEFLAPILPFFKIPSGEITNLPYLRKINSYKKDVILSTGLSTLEEVKQAVKILKDCRVKVLHCTTEYPCPYKDVNLNAMLSLKKELNVDIGYSDHTIGIEIPIMAVSLGAKIIEKHFTLDKNMDGPDHKASLEPHELKKMIIAIRNVEKAFGNGLKIPSEIEKKNIEIVRKSIVAKAEIKKGDFFTEKNLTVKRPGNGISPMMWDEIIGKSAKKDFKIDEIIEI